MGFPMSQSSEKGTTPVFLCYCLKCCCKSVSGSAQKEGPGQQEDRARHRCGVSAPLHSLACFPCDSNLTDGSLRISPPPWLSSPWGCHAKVKTTWSA